MIIPKIIFKKLFALKKRSKDKGKMATAKIAKLFGVPMVLKEEILVKSNGKRKIL